MTLTSHRHQVLKLRMTGAIPLLSHLHACYAQRQVYWGRRCDDFAVLKFHSGQQVAMGVPWNVMLCLSLGEHSWPLHFQKKIAPSTSGSEGPDTHQTNCLQTAVHMRSLPCLTSKPSAGGAHMHQHFLDHLPFRWRLCILWNVENSVTSLKTTTVRTSDLAKMLSLL